MFFGPTGRTLRQGEGYFADHELFFASASVGITDRVQLGGGTIIIPNSQFWFVMPKVGIVQGEKFSVDLALMNSVRTPVFPGFPYVDFVIKW